MSKWLRCSYAGPFLVWLRLFLPVTRVFSCYCCLFGGQALGCCKAAGEKIDWKTELNEGGEIQLHVFRFVFFRTT